MLHQILAESGEGGCIPPRRGEQHPGLLQVQNREHGVPLYRTPVRIGIVTASGKRVEEVWLTGQAEEETFVLPSQEEPLLVHFDEGNWLLKEWSYPKTTRELLYQARNDDVIGRQWAVRQLGGGEAAGAVAGGASGITGANSQVTETLTLVAQEDSFWAVRVAALESRAGLREPTPPVELFKAAGGGENSRVRRTAIRLLGETRDPALVSLFRERFSADDSYQAQAETLRSIGRTGDRSQLPFLREALAVPSHQNVIRQAAEWAIAEISGR